MTPEPAADLPIDHTEQPTALVYVSRLSGNGIVAGFGYTKAFAFSVPEALRRLATELEKDPQQRLPEKLRPTEATPIDDCEISVRLYNCLRYAEPPIKTLGELADKGIELLGIKNLGAGSLREAMRLLNSVGMTLKEPAAREYAPWRLIWEKAKERLEREELAGRP